MRTPLPNLRPNGHLPIPGQVFVIAGMCQDPRFRLRFHNAAEGDFCLIYLGASQFGVDPAQVGLIEESSGDPYFVLRRHFDDGAAAVTLRVDWEGIFTLLANDDAAAEAVFQEMVQPGSPEEVNRQWSEDASTLRMFADLLFLN